MDRFIILVSLFATCDPQLEADELRHGFFVTVRIDLS
jgi:hypothetical protein